MDIISLLSIVLVTSSLGALLAQNKSWRAQRGLDLPGQKLPSGIQQLKRILVTWIDKSGGHNYYYDGPNELEAKQGWYRGMSKLAVSGGTLEFSVSGIVRDRKSNL